MKYLFVCFILVFSTSVNAFQAPSDVDMDLVTQMVEDSELIRCQSNICLYVTDGTPHIHDENYPDGLIVAFPKGRYSITDEIMYREYIMEVWLNALRLTE